MTGFDDRHGGAAFGAYIEGRLMIAERSPAQKAKHPYVKLDAVAEFIHDADKYVITSEVLTMADELSAAGFALTPLGERCWLEWTSGLDRDPSLWRRVGILLMDRELSGVTISAALGSADPTWLSTSWPVVGRLFVLDQDENAIKGWGFAVDLSGKVKVSYDRENGPTDELVIQQILAVGAAAVELIRHPRAVARVAHAERTKLVHGKGGYKPAKFSAYTEVLIHVTREETGGAAGERGDGETGVHKRFHHVRPFARVRLGKPELVVGHWRGDPKLGVSPPRPYRVVP